MLLAQQFKIIHHKMLEVDRFNYISVTFILLKCGIIYLWHLPNNIFIIVEQLMFHNLNEMENMGFLRQNLVPETVKPI